VLEKLTRRSQNDAYTILKIAETGQQEGLDFEGNYTVEEINEYVATMKKLLVVRDVVLNINREYIRSAGQAREYRTEPAFLLQGSYRNMNRIAGRVLPVMNDEELWTLIYSTYEQDAQTLTSGAESNLLKFRELTGRLDDEQSKRWEEIRKTFRRNLLLGDDSDDKAGRIIQQLNAFGAGLDSIKDVLTEGVTAIAARSAPKQEPAGRDEFKVAADDVLGKMSQLIAEIKQQRSEDAQRQTAHEAEQVEKDSQMLVSVLEEQFKAMETWLLPMAHDDKKDRNRTIGELLTRFETMMKGYGRLIEVLESKRGRIAAPPAPKSKAKGKASKPTRRKPPAQDESR
jgi:hypothetical protein